MNPVTVSTHLLITCLISLTLIVFMLIFHKTHTHSQNSKLWTITIIFLCIYCLFNTWALVDDILIQLHLNQFDLNQDGFFTIDEITDKQQRAYKSLIHDTSRNLMPFLGLFYALVFSILVTNIIFALKKSHRPKKV